MNPLTIGSVTLGEIPRVVAIVDEFLDSHHIAGLEKTGADLLEIRCDLLGSDIPSLCVFIDKIKKTTNFPCIGTVRETDENRAKRMDIFKAVIPFVDAIDIEIDSSIARQVLRTRPGRPSSCPNTISKRRRTAAHLHGIAERAHGLGAIS